MCKVAKENWSTDELVILLEPLVKKKKVEFLKDGKPTLLRKGVDFTQYKGAFNIGGIKGGGTNKRRIMKKKIQEAFDLIELDNQIMKGILGE